MKGYLISYLIGALSLFIILFLLFKVWPKIDFGIITNRTNIIKVDLTNYIKKEKPIFHNINLTNVVQTSNFVTIVLTTNEYSNLISVIVDDSNFSQSDIRATISNNILILSHYSVTNLIKLPDYLFLNKKNSTVEIGYSVKQNLLLGYNYRLIKFKNLDFDIGIFSIINLASNNFDLGIKGSIEF